MKLARRAFLKVMGAAPVAVPFAAKEAILSASGVASAVGAASVGGLNYGGELAWTGQNLVSPDKQSYGEYIKNQLIEYKSAAYRESLLKQETVLRLEPDVAAMRSISASAQIAIQKERNVSRHIQYRIDESERDLESYLKNQMRITLGL